MERHRDVMYGLLGGLLLASVIVSLETLGEMPAREWRSWGRAMYIVGLAAVGAAVGSRFRHWWELAMTDPLTGLYNRRYFTGVLARLFARARRDGTPVSVLILDVDDFKEINDRFGHAEGDRVLKAVAAAIRNTCRSCDVVVRWGGEEFAVLLPNTDGPGARQAGERIASQVQAKTGVTVSVGWATYPEVEEDELIAVADRRMYESKQRNRRAVRR
ncbi:MAG: GGDEF domain-containing protein [Firmicutes bacterium]|nr:GGDEF domain-containing protein [Bacillota bacterium]